MKKLLMLLHGIVKKTERTPQDAPKALATKAVFVWALQQVLDGGMTKAKLARKLETSRQQLDRLLDLNNTSINLKTMERIADVLHKRLVVTLEDAA